MPGTEGSIENILQSLQERAKELNCLYQVDEILSQRDAPVDRVHQQRWFAIGDRHNDVGTFRDVFQNALGRAALALEIHQSGLDVSRRRVG